MAEAMRKPLRRSTLVQISWPPDRQDVLDDLDAAVPNRGRSAFIIEAVREKLARDAKRKAAVS